MRRPLALLAAAAVSLLVPAAASAAPAAQSRSQPVYLALGDSVAAGVGAPAGKGYVPLLAEKLRESALCLPEQASRSARGCQQLQLVDLSRGGATTESLIATQLPAAVELLERRNGDRNPRNDVEVITVTIGGNDVFRPVVQACIEGTDPVACQATVQGVLSEYGANLTTILAALRAAAGPETTIVATAYYNPLAGCFLRAYVPLGDQVLEGGGAVPVGLNDVTRQIAAQFGAEVADAYDELDVEDYVGGQDCLHPDASGHAVLAGIFEDVVVG